MNKKVNILTWIHATLRESAWAPAMVFGFYLIGIALGFFDNHPSLDIPAHLIGGVSITYFFRGAIRNSQKLFGDIPLMIQILFGFTCTGTTTVLWELYENFCDHFFGTHMVRGLEDTIVDLLMGLSGALIFSILYRRR